MTLYHHSHSNGIFSMYRRMRQERKKREDDDAHSVISEARSQRSMVIDGGSVKNFLMQENV